MPTRATRSSPRQRKDCFHIPRRPMLRGNGGHVDELDPLSAAILEMLADAPEPGGVSLPRIGKRLGVSASVLLRHLTLMGDAVIGGKAGPGLVRVTQTEDRWIVFLTDAGRDAANAMGRHNLE